MIHCLQLSFGSCNNSNRSCICSSSYVSWMRTIIKKNLGEDSQVSESPTGVVRALVINRHTARGKRSSARSFACILSIRFMTSKKEQNENVTWILFTWYPTTATAMTMTTQTTPFAVTQKFYRHCSMTHPGRGCRIYSQSWSTHFCWQRWINIITVFSPRYDYLVGVHQLVMDVVTRMISHIANHLRLLLYRWWLMKMGSLSIPIVRRRTYIMRVMSCENGKTEILTDLYVFDCYFPPDKIAVVEK